MAEQSVTAWTIARGIILAVVILAAIPFLVTCLADVRIGGDGASDRDRCEQENEARERRGIDDPINCD